MEKERRSITPSYFRLDLRISPQYGISFPFGLRFRGGTHSQGMTGSQQRLKNVISIKEFLFVLAPFIFPWTPGFAYISLKSLEKFLLKQVGAWLTGLFPLFSTQVVNNGLYSNVDRLCAGNLRADKAHCLRPDCQTHALLCSPPGLCFSIIRATWQNAKHSHGPMTLELMVSSPTPNPQPFNGIPP